MADETGITASDSFGMAVIEQPSGQKPCIHRENLTSEVLLDRDFRQTGGAENGLVLWILDERGRPQARGVGL